MEKPNHEFQDKKEITPALTRAQRREKERIEKEADMKLNAMVKKFADYLTDCDNPESEEAIEKRKVMSAQWKMYCMGRSLTKESGVQFDKYATAIMDKYKVTKEESIST